MKQRQIKFRAWDAHKKKMYNVGVLGIFDNCSWQHGFSYLHNTQEWYGEEGMVIDPILMQFTGLHDRNGKEIYIGDKIKDMLTLAEYEVKEGFCKRYAFTGVYCENFSQQKPLNADSDTDKNSQIEVIGNIHEK